MISSQQRVVAFVSMVPVLAARAQHLHLPVKKIVMMLTKRAVVVSLYYQAMYAFYVYF